MGGATFEVLSPPRDWQVAARVRNNDSLVLKIRYRNSAVLLPADAEKKIERALVENGPQLQAELLKVGHNGSLTSSAPEFLDAVRPQFAFISVGYRNSFHHPRPEVLERLAERHIVTFRTDIIRSSVWASGPSIAMSASRAVNASSLPSVGVSESGATASVACR